MDSRFLSAYWLGIWLRLVGMGLLCVAAIYGGMAEGWVFVIFIAQVLFPSSVLLVLRWRYSMSVEGAVRRAQLSLFTSLLVVVVATTADHPGSAMTMIMGAGATITLALALLDKLTWNVANMYRALLGAACVTMPLVLDSSGQLSPYHGAAACYGFAASLLAAAYERSSSLGREGWLS